MSWWVLDSHFRRLGEPDNTRASRTYKKRSKFRHRRPAPPSPPPVIQEDGTFTTRLHYSGVMDESCGKQYLIGVIDYIHKCDPDRWSKLEVDDYLEKVGQEVSKLEYFFLKPGMNLDEGLVRLFDNKSSMEMVELGVKAGVIDLYAVETNEVLVSQLTQDHTHTHVDVSDHWEGDGVMSDYEGEDGEWAGLVGDTDGGDGAGLVGNTDGGDGAGVVGTDGAELVGADEMEDVQVDKGNGKAVGNSKAKEKPKDKEKSTDEGRFEGADKGKGKVDIAEKENVDGPTFVDSDYDLSDTDEDDIMAAQVEGWKKVVDVMSTYQNDQLGDTSDSDNLPSESPSSRPFTLRTKHVKLHLNVIVGA